MKDIVADFSNGTIFKAGDLNTGPCDTQNQYLLLMCEKGSFKQFPATGVGMVNYLEGEDPAALLREVRTQFMADGLKISRVVMEDYKLKVDATY